MAYAVQCLRIGGALGTIPMERLQCVNDRALWESLIKPALTAWNYIDVAI